MVATAAPTDVRVAVQAARPAPSAAHDKSNSPAVLPRGAGENDCLVVRRGRGWSRLLAAEPGSIGVLDSGHGGYADVELRSLGLCILRMDRDHLREGRIERLPIRRPAIGRRRRGPHPMADQEHSCAMIRMR